ncbi:MAG: PIG-L family deacetylase [Acidobacteria bacterium]|nr:PIG-L family deacetylase [Acidobacteriota bacterium]
MLERLCGAGPGLPGPRTLLVVAHPDDEILGAGSRLAHLPGLGVVFLTDGAPRDLADARAAGFERRERYAVARRREAAAALRAAGAAHARQMHLGAVDQEAVFALSRLAGELARIVERERPELLLTHAYEGGHPDHDAAAFVARAAVRAAEAGGARAALAEFPLYNQPGEGPVRHDFLPGGDPGRTLRLDAAQRATKLQALACHATQERVWRGMPVDEERFRLAPAHDFTRAPHAGRLHYERFAWGVSAALWCELARKALAELEPCC